MTEPRRWKDTHDAPVGVRELLSASRAGPPRRALDRATFEQGAARVARLGSLPVAAAAGVAVGVWTKLAAAAVIGVAGVGAVLAVKHIVTADAERAVLERAREQAEANAQVQANAEANADANARANEEANGHANDAVRAASVVAARAEGADAMGPTRGKVMPHAPSAQAPATATSSPTVTEPAPPKAELAATLGAELALLQEARAALARDPSTALALVAQHRARFPSGVLGAERDLIALDALRRSGRTGEARALALAWLEREPTGLHAPRVRAILRSLDRPVE
jgi:hypothetical protein